MVRGGGFIRSAQSKDFRLRFLAHFSTDQDEILYLVEAFYIEYSDITFEI